MAPVSGNLIGRAVVTASAAATLARRDLSVNHTQAVTLGVIVAYVVVIALLWNIPYIRWVLWPFKVRNMSEFTVRFN